MKKVININLGGLPYIIDEDAYLFLNNYLEAIRRHFSYSEGCEEIMYDIELRLSELFQEQLKAKQIITMNELEAAIDVMGTPEDFGAENDDATYGNFSKNSSASSDYKYVKTGKRLFRNPEDKVIGGVCSGLSAYLGIDDPVWIRILFCVFLFTGFGFFAYIMLMIVVPNAETAADKLAMRGEPINIENIAKTVENEIDEISQAISNLGSKKKKSLKTQNNGLHYFETISKAMISTVGGIFSLFITVIRNILKGIFSVGLFGVIFILTIFCVIITFVVIKLLPLSAFISPLGTFQTKITILSALALLIIPFIGLAFILGRRMYPNRIKSPSGYLTLTWIVSLIICVFSAIEIGFYLASHKSRSNLTNISRLGNGKDFNIIINDMEHLVNPTGTIHIGNSVLIYPKNIRFEENFGNVLNEIDVKVMNKIIVERTKDNDISVLEQADNLHNEKIVDGLFFREDDKLVFSVYKKIVKPEKYFGEKVTYKVFLPQGFALNFDSRIKDIIELKDGVKSIENGNSVKVF